jgi:putative tricarboxylic transport membrane protein
MRAKPAEVVLSLAILALGISVAVATARMPSAGGYSRIGPNFMPGAVAVGLILLGGRLSYEALSGGWRGCPDAPEERGLHSFKAGAFIWVSVGLFAHMLLIDRAGFVLAGAALFVCVAQGFGSSRLARDGSIGIVMSLAIFFFFVHFLNVNLPAGWLKPILGSAGL